MMFIFLTIGIVMLFGFMNEWGAGAQYYEERKSYEWDNGYERFGSHGPETGCAAAYRVLGIQQNASEKEIKMAYRQLAIKFHPDKYATQSIEVQQEAEQKFKEISQAYNTIRKARHF